jgi:hypothetical protein
LGVVTESRGCLPGTYGLFPLFFSGTMRAVVDARQSSIPGLNPPLKCGYRPPHKASPRGGKTGPNMAVFYIFESGKKACFYTTFSRRAFIYHHHWYCQLNKKMKKNRNKTGPKEAG